MRTLTAFDVDTDALAETFDRMADGLRSGDVLVDELVAREVVDVDAPDADFRFEMAYHATHGFVDVTDAIEYDVDDFDRKWEQYRQVDRDLSERLGLGDTIAGDQDKEQARELYEDGRLRFVGNVPVVTPEGGVDE